jgi:hypothetical protein
MARASIWSKIQARDRTMSLGEAVAIDSGIARAIARRNGTAVHFARARKLTAEAMEIQRLCDELGCDPARIRWMVEQLAIPVP